MWMKSEFTSRSNHVLVDNFSLFYWWQRLNKTNNCWQRLDCDCTPTPSDVFRYRIRTIHLDVPSTEPLVPKSPQCSWWISIHSQWLREYWDTVPMWCHDWLKVSVVLWPINAMSSHSSILYCCPMLRTSKFRWLNRRRFVGTLWLLLSVAPSLERLPFDRYLSLLLEWKSKTKSHFSFDSWKKTESLVLYQNETYACQKAI